MERGGGYGTGWERKRIVLGGCGSRKIKER